MKILILAAVRCSLIFTAVAVTSLVCVQPAQAYTVTLQQVGSNVVANGSGAINLTGLTFITSVDDVNPGANAALGLIATGPFAASVDAYQGLTGPTDFGSGAPLLAQHCKRRLCRNFGRWHATFRATQLCLRRCSIGQHDL